MDINFYQDDKSYQEKKKNEFLGESAESRRKIMKYALAMSKLDK